MEADYNKFGHNYYLIITLFLSFELIFWSVNFSWCLTAAICHRPSAMGAVKWTWSELADMHLCLGAARAAGGDAAKAKLLYQKRYPDRGVPGQGTFITVDLCLRATGQLQ